MKFLLFAVGAMAATKVQRDINAIVSDIAAVQSATSSLDTAVKGFNGAGDAAGVLSAVSALNDAITKGTTDTKSSGQLSITDATSLVTPAQNLQAVVKSATDDAVAKKSAFVSAGLGGEVETQLMTIQSNAQAFISAISGAVPSSLSSTAQSLTAPILTDLQNAVTAFQGTGGSSSSSASASASSTSAAASSSSASASASASSSSAAASSSSAAASSSSASASKSSASASSTGTTTPVTGTGSSNGTSSSSPSVVPYTGAASGMAVGLTGVAAAAVMVLAF